jgi:hypothetical protein
MVDVEEKISATKATVTSANILIVTWMLIGTAGITLINPLYGVLFLGFSALSVYIIMRRMVCSSGCYYCKSCTKGTAKLSIMFLGANRVPGLGKGSIVGMTVFAYIVLLVIPGWMLTASLLRGFSVVTATVLVALLAISVYGIVARVRKGNKLITS